MITSPEKIVPLVYGGISYRRTSDYAQYRKCGKSRETQSPKDPNRINNTMCPKTTKNKKIAISYIIEL